jgi:L-lysine 2,3-aminomutase
MDGIVARIQEYTKVREQSVTKLEEQLGLLTQQEEELRQRIEKLKDVPLPAAEYFASLVNKGEKSSALRDYVLFAAGVVVTAGVTILLKHFGLA